jgi:hypothetical protein
MWKKLACLLFHRGHWYHFQMDTESSEAHCQKCGALWGLRGYSPRNNQ